MCKPRHRSGMTFQSTPLPSGRGDPTSRRSTRSRSRFNPLPSRAGEETSLRAQDPVDIFAVSIHSPPERERRPAQACARLHAVLFQSTPLPSGRGDNALLEEALRLRNVSIHSPPERERRRSPIRPDPGGDPRFNPLPSRAGEETLPVFGSTYVFTLFQSTPLPSGRGDAWKSARSLGLMCFNPLPSRAGEETRCASHAIGKCSPLHGWTKGEGCAGSYQTLSRADEGAGSGGRRWLRVRRA